MIIGAISNIFWNFLSYTWWLWPLIIFMPLLQSTLVFIQQEKFKRSITWVLLELRIPREVAQGPEAMEQVLGAYNTLRNAPGDFKEYYVEGEVTRWFSFEIVSFGGEVRFYIRTYIKLRQLVEASLQSYYPDIEIVETEDYISKFPANFHELVAEEKDVWGTEMILTKPYAYPIKSYQVFNSGGEGRMDPMSVFLEILGKIKPDEIVAIQFNASPKGGNWREKHMSVLEGLKATKSKAKATTEDPFAGLTTRTPGETAVIKAIEDNLSKSAFDVLIRFMYISPKATFLENLPRRGIMGAFNQYSSLDLNSFRSNRPLETRARIWNWPHILPKLRVKYKKQRLLYNYRLREIPIQAFMGKFITSYLFNWNFYSRFLELSTESLAALFHPPTKMVLTAPYVKRMESKRVGPPAGLAIFGEESEIEKFR